MQSHSLESRTHRSYFAHRVKPPNHPLTPISLCYIHSTRSSSTAWRMNLVRAGKSVLLYKTPGQFRVMEHFYPPRSELPLVHLAGASPHGFSLSKRPEVFIRIPLSLPFSLSLPHDHTIKVGLKGIVNPNFFVIIFPPTCHF